MKESPKGDLGTLGANGGTQLSWYLAQTAPAREFKSSDLLTRFEYPNHVFKHQISVPRRGRLVDLFVPAFPRYIFLFVTNEARMLLETIWEFVCLSDFVRVGHDAVVAERALKFLLDQSLPGDVLSVDNEVQSKFKFGDRVEIITSSHVAFGCEGVYQYTVRPGRVCILSPWLGQLVPVEVNESDVELFVNSKSKRRRRGRSRRLRSPYRQENEIALSA